MNKFSAYNFPSKVTLSHGLRLPVFAVLASVLFVFACSPSKSTGDLKATNDQSVSEKVDDSFNLDYVETGKGRVGGTLKVSLALYVVVNAVVDILYGLIDPRVVLA
jgi:hypothetical protein